MDSITILQTLLRWALPALAGGAAALLALWAAYRLFFRGRRPLTRLQAASLGLLCVWLSLVVCLTSLSRGANFAGQYNFHLLSGYINAWNHWSLRELQLILFNMLMFAPLGFLLPLAWPKARRFWVTAAASLAVTGGIEFFQFVTGTGIFELDDLLHNLIGSLFGYFCIMAVLSAAREKALRPGPVARVLLIPGLIGLGLGAAFYLYARQPYGNLPIRPASPQDMSAVRVVTTDWAPATQTGTAAVYRSRHTADKAYRQQIRDSFAALEGLTVSQTDRRDGETRVCTGTNAQGTAFQMDFFVRTGEWSYTTFADTAAQLTQDEIRQRRTRYEDWMRENGLLPENAVFSVQNGDTLRWDAQPPADPAAGQADFQQGSVMIQFDEAGAVTAFYYQIAWNVWTAESPILSERQAFAQVQDGNFSQYIPFQPGETLHVTGCTLDYVWDTKGFYQPVYTFSGYRSGPEDLWVCQIPALAA